MVLVLLLVSLPGSAQQAEHASGASQMLALWARPLTPIDTATAKPDQLVELELWRETRDSDGRVVIPKGARLFGSITLVEPRGRHGEARLALYILKAEWKDGRAVLNAFLAGPVCVPWEKSGASLVTVDKAVVRVVHGPVTVASARHREVVPQRDDMYGVVYVSRDEEIRLTRDVLLPLRHIPPDLLTAATHR
ncbi:MAG TPA: hypothetical protein VNK82_12210 [Terriglobales bacterium]|nr:hypothetical protein [Terriglobales bacterium]